MSLIGAPGLDFDGDAIHTGETTPADPSENDLWFNGSAVKKYDGSTWVDISPVPPVTKTQETALFDGSNHSLNLEGQVDVVSGSIQLISDTESYSNSLGNSFDSSEDEIAVQPKTDLKKVEVTCDIGSGSFPTIRVEDLSDNTIIAEKSAGYTDGSTETFAPSEGFSAGGSYAIYGWDGGNSYTTNWGNGTYTDGTHVDVIRWTGSGTNTDAIATFGAVTATIDDTQGSGEVTFDNVAPESWDLAGFGESPDTETVTIDIIDSNDNVLIADIGDNHDISTIDPGTNFRFRVTLERTDTSNNPTVDYLARRYLP